MLLKLIKNNYFNNKITISSRKKNINIFLKKLFIFFKNKCFFKMKIKLFFIRINI